MEIYTIVYFASGNLEMVMCIHNLRWPSREYVALDKGLIASPFYCGLMSLNIYDFRDKKHISLAFISGKIQVLMYMKSEAYHTEPKYKLCIQTD